MAADLVGMDVGEYLSMVTTHTCLLSKYARSTNTCPCGNSGSVFVLLLAVGVKWGLYELHRQEVATDIASLWKQGLGTFQRYAYIPQVSGGDLTSWSTRQAPQFLRVTAAANFCQVWASSMSMLLNNILTRMLVAEEWNSYIHRRKPLRVSRPKGIQRSKYFLSLPLKYSLSLMVGMGLLHWLLSQSLFVVESIQLDLPDFEPAPEWDAAVLGYSVIGLILTLGTSVTMFLAPLVLGFWMRLKAPVAGKQKQHQQRGSEDSDGESLRAGAVSSWPMPLVRTCSAAISAACHRHPRDVDVHLLPLTWGYAPEDSAGNGRFCFTTASDVSWPEDLPVNTGGNNSESGAAGPEIQLDLDSLDSDTWATEAAQNLLTFGGEVDDQ